MKCPRCSDATLLMTEKSGVEIDYCPNCRGVWLDRGELDKILERANGSDYDRHSSQHHDDHCSKHHDDHGYKREKEHVHGYNNHHKKSFWKDIFDF